MAIYIYLMRNYKAKYFIFFILSIIGCYKSKKSELIDPPCVILKPESTNIIVGQYYRVEIFFYMY
jgi:hypothetical protein